MRLQFQPKKAVFFSFFFVSPELMLYLELKGAANAPESDYVLLRRFLKQEPGTVSFRKVSGLKQRL